MSHDALVTGIVTTKRSEYQRSNAALKQLLTVYRDIYYRDPELFLKQAVVDRYVDDIAYTFGVNRDALNVVSLPSFVLPDEK